MTRTHAETTTSLALVPALLAALFLLPLAAQPAQADHSGWSLGAGFHIGGAYFNLAFGAHDGRHPGYYYRTSHRIHYSGHRCSSLCFRDRGHAFHHVSCPLLGAHLSHYDVHPVILFDRFAPRPVWRGHHYRVVSPYRYDRHHRYDRRLDRYDRRHDRYDRRYDRYERRDRHYRDHRRHGRRDRYDRDWRNDHHRGRGHHRPPG